MGDVHHCSGLSSPNKMTYSVSSGTLNSTVPYHVIHAAASGTRYGGCQVITSSFCKG